jgi:stage V sporulation protein B
VAQTNTYQNTLLLVLFSALSVVLAYALRVLYARTFSPADYGLLYAVIALALIFAIIRNMGLTEAVTYFIARQERVPVVRVALYSQFIFSVVLYIALLCSASYLSIFVLHDMHATNLMLLIGIAYLIVGFNEVFVAYFRGRQQNTLFGLAEPLRLVFVLGATVLLFLLFTPNLFSAALAWVIAYAALVILYGAFYYRNRTQAIPLTLKHAKTVYAYALPSFLAAAGLLLFYNVDTLIITYFLGTYATGLYNVSLPVANLLLVFSLPFSVILFPIVSGLWKPKTKKQVQPLLDSFYRYTFIACLALAAVLLVTGKQLIVVFFGEAYIGAYAALVILIGASLIRSLVELQFSVLAGIGAVRTRAALLFIALAVNVVLNILFVQFFGIVGAAAATTLSFLLLFITTTFYLRKSGITFPYKKFSAILGVSIPFFIAAWLIASVLPQRFSFLALVGVALAVLICFLGWLLVWRVVRVAECAAAVSLIKKRFR